MIERGLTTRRREPRRRVVTNPNIMIGEGTMRNRPFHLRHMTRKAIADGVDGTDGFGMGSRTGVA